MPLGAQAVGGLFLAMFLFPREAASTYLSNKWQHIYQISIHITHWRYERLKEKNGWTFENALRRPKYVIEKNGWMFENALRRPKYVIEKNGWMFENALRRPKYVIESPEYRFETTQCNSLINS